MGPGHGCRGTAGVRPPGPARDGLIGWRHVRLAPASGKPVGPTTVSLKDYGGGAGKLEGAIIDGTWTWGIGRQSGNAFTVGKTTANIMA